MIKKIITLFFCMIFLPPLAYSKEALTIGVVPQFDSYKMHNIWDPIAKLLSKKLNQPVVFKQAIDIPSFGHEMQKGAYDIVYSNPYQLLQGNESQGYQPIIKDGSRNLSGIIVVKKDSKITKLSQLNDTVIAFPSPNALGAALLIRATLSQKNISFTPKYVKNHPSVYLNTVLGTVQAGGGVRASFNQQKPEIKNNLRILFETEKVTPHPIAIHPRIAKLQDRIQQAFFEIEKETKMLNAIPMRAVSTTTIDDYQSLKSLHLENFIEKR